MEKLSKGVLLDILTKINDVKRLTTDELFALSLSVNKELIDREFAPLPEDIDEEFLDKLGLKIETLQEIKIKKDYYLSNDYKFDFILFFDFKFNHFNKDKYNKSWMKGKDNRDGNIIYFYPQVFKNHIIVLIINSTNDMTKNSIYFIKLNDFYHWYSLTNDEDTLSEDYRKLLNL